MNTGVGGAEVPPTPSSYSNNRTIGGYNMKKRKKIMSEIVKERRDEVYAVLLEAAHEDPPRRLAADEIIDKCPSLTKDEQVSYILVSVLSGVVIPIRDSERFGRNKGYGLIGTEYYEYILDTEGQVQKVDEVVTPDIDVEVLTPVEILTPVEENEKTEEDPESKVFTYARLRHREVLDALLAGNREEGEFALVLLGKIRQAGTQLRLFLDEQGGLNCVNDAREILEALVTDLNTYWFGHDEEGEA
jgi:hypothetical protein